MQTCGDKRRRHMSDVGIDHNLMCLQLLVKLIKCHHNLFEYLFIYLFHKCQIINQPEDAASVWQHVLNERSITPCCHQLVLYSSLVLGRDEVVAILFQRCKWRAQCHATSCVLLLFIVLSTVLCHFCLKPQLSICITDWVTASSFMLISCGDHLELVCTASDYQYFQWFVRFLSQQTNRVHVKR